jgi:uncharacterized membrane protein (DUF485 family)
MVILGRDWNELTQSEKSWIYKAMKYFHWRKNHSFPKPIKISFLAAIFSFLLLSIFPLEPMSIPAAFGGGLSIALIFGR